MSDWPDPTLPWEYPDETEENAARWQSAIDVAVAAGGLMIRRSGYKTFSLSGACPRCSHPTSHSFEVGVVMGVDAVQKVRARTNVDCQCRLLHDGRPDKRDGCGWGGPLITRLSVTVGDDDDAD